MPELPEVERVRRSLAMHLIGRRIVDVTIRRAEVVDFGALAVKTKASMAKTLLLGQTIASLDRRGKQIAVIAAGSTHETSPALCIHLGMTGSVIHQSPPIPAADEKHAHLVWHLDTGHCVYFHDPRRFGGVWCFGSFAALLAERWRALGADALSISASALHERLRGTHRHLKAVLLDQSVLAGLGNIYVDELLFERGLHPMMRASRLKIDRVDELVIAMRDLLSRAIDSGGSTLRNYVDANGQAGGFQFEHRVYGRGGKPCLRCEKPLKSQVVAGRTTVFCPGCQKRSG